MTRLAWAISLFAASFLFAQPRTTFRLESNAIFTGHEHGDVWIYPPDTGKWRERYVHELRVFLKGSHERRAGYRVEPRFWFTHQPDSTEEFDWVLDQAYGYLNPSPRVTFLMGKQRARWGTGLTYTPTDNLQRSADPLDPSRYLEGVYLARMDATLPWFSASLLYTPDRNNGYDELPIAVNTSRMAGARLFKLVGTVDLYATALHNFDDETNVGGAFSWDSGPVVLYGEAAWLLRENSNLRHYLALESGTVWKPRAVLGASKLFGNSSVYGEIYYTGWGLNREEYADYLSRFREVADVTEWLVRPASAIEYANLLLLTKPTQELHQVYVAASGVYNWRDLWTFGGNLIFEPVDGTLYGYPLITFIGYPNVDIAAGFSFATGSSDSELPVLPAYVAADMRFVIHF
ncbi:MAG: hypothetical protein H6508_01445 [Calditrichaeota bacterium]|nr:hypothetical protein [Calditrichota bacterium]MCB9365841.1 hypothetical protein [Calditrichota bacterium]